MDSKISSNQKTNKEEIRKFKVKADNFNKGLYSDIASFRNGLIFILVAISIVLLLVFFKWI